MMKLKIMVVAMVMGTFGFSAMAQDDKSKKERAKADTVKQAGTQAGEITKIDTSAVSQERCIIRLDEIDYTKMPE